MNKEKFPILNTNNRNLRIQTDNLQLYKHSKLERSNTQPNPQIIKQSLKPFLYRQNLQLIRSKKNQKRFSNRQSHIFQNFIDKPNKISLVHQSQGKNKISYELMQYRKSIKQLIHIFQQRSNQIKSLNENCLYSLVNAKNSKQMSAFNEMIMKQVQATKIHRSKNLKLKKKLKKSTITKTQNNQLSPNHRGKNHTDLKQILNINTSCVEDKIISPNSRLKNRQMDLLVYPKLTKEVAYFPVLSKQKMHKFGLSKMTTLNGWKIDQNDTNYLL